MLNFQVISVVLVYISQIYAQCEKYYHWKEYTGTIPHDALIGGYDAIGNPLYMGHGYIHDYGLYIAKISSGVKEVDVPCYGVKTVPFDIKILCTDTPYLFNWVKTSANTYVEDTANTTVVIGGYDNINDNGFLPIGRVFFQGEYIAGVVTPHTVNNGGVRLWFVHKKVERGANFFEVLTVSEPQIDNNKKA